MWEKESVSQSGRSWFHRASALASGFPTKLLLCFTCPGVTFSSVLQLSTGFHCVGIHYLSTLPQSVGP
jgi:hypothetical protein